MHPIPGFGRFLTARAVSWAGSAVTTVALPVLLYQRTGSAALSGILAALEALPYLLLGLPAGALADRWNRARTMAWCSRLSAALVAAIPLAAGAHVLTTAQLLLTGPAVASVFVFFDAAAFGALPALVGRADVDAATARMMTVATLTGLIGPSAGGLLIAAVGAPGAMAVDALSYLAAALLLARLALPDAAADGRHGEDPGRTGYGPAEEASANASAAEPPAGARRPMRADIGEGLAFIRGHPLIRSLTLLGIGNSFTEGAVVALIVVSAVRHLGMSAHDQRIGLLWAAAGAGALVAAALLPRLRRVLAPGRLTLAALAGNAVFLACWACAPGLGTGLVALACWQGANTLVSLNGIVIRQQLTPDRLQGRVNTTARMIAWGGQPFGALTAGILAGVLGVRGALLLACAPALISLAAGLRSPLRSPVRPPLPPSSSLPPGQDAAAPPPEVGTREATAR